MGHHHGQSSANFFEPESWDERYTGSERVWSGRANPQLVTVASDLPLGSALDVGCGEGGDVIWLAHQGWSVTGADFSQRGLERAARNAETAGVSDRVSWWRVDARTFDAGGREFDLVTTHYLHPPDGGMADVLARLADAVGPGGHLLVVGHAPDEVFHRLDQSKRDAMFHAEDLRPAVPPGFEVVVLEDRHRSVVRDGVQHDVADATVLLLRA